MTAENQLTDNAPAGDPDMLGVPQTANIADAGTSEMEVDDLHVPSRFAVTSAESANWLIKTVVASRIYREHVRDWAEREQHRAEQEEERLLYLFGGQLRTWVMMEIGRRRGRRKSVSLPGGTAGYRSVGPTLVIQDEQRVLKWAKQNCPSAIVVVERLSKTAINEHLVATGEVPPEGVAIAPAQEKFYIS